MKNGKKREGMKGKPSSPFPSLPTTYYWIVGVQNSVFTICFFPTGSLGCGLEVHYIPRGGEGDVFLQILKYT